MAVVVPAQGAYVIDPAHSRIGFIAKHQFGLGTVRGSFGLTSGEITIANPAIDSVVRAVVDAASFTSGSGSRDKKVRSSTFLDVDREPNILFESTAARVDDAGAWTLRGVVTARGVSSPVELTVTRASTADGELALTATAQVDRYAHGITAMKGIAGRYLRLTVDVHARRTS